MYVCVRLRALFGKRRNEKDTSFVGEKKNRKGRRFVVKKERGMCVCVVFVRRF